MTSHCINRIAMASVLFIALGCRDAPPAPRLSETGSDPELSVDEQGGETLPFDQLQLFFEFNSTDNDLGLQLLLDGDDWKRVRGFDPSKKKFFEIVADGRLRELGLTELFFESAEPSPGEVLALFPAGTYSFTGRTVENDNLVGQATLSHALPPAPVFTPTDGATVNPANFVIQWNAMGGLASIQVIVEDENTERSLTVELLPSATSFTVPPGFLESGTEYKIEVLAVATNGNKTISEATVTTS